MIPLTTPPLAEVFRADTKNVDTAISSLMEHYAPPDGGGPFNYLRAVKTIKKAYQGVHRLELLTATTHSEKKRIGYKSNQDVISMAAPVAFGRSTRVFDLSARKFPFGRERYASYRIPFFFVEEKVVRLYFLQYRKNYILDADVYAGMYTVQRKFLLEQEFYGLKTDVEFVDCGAIEEGGSRVLRCRRSGDLEMWSDERLRDHLAIVAAALDEIERREPDIKRTRPLRDAELPLFD